MFVQKNFLLIVLALAVVFAFAMRATIFQQSASSTTVPANDTPNGFDNYWSTGKAEVNSYRLEQAQNGALNPGEAVLLFEIEAFRTDKQVKAQTPDGQEKAIPVLKTTLSKKFVTGLTEHSLLTSVFTPINNPLFPNTLKISASEQGWSGHSYTQINYRNNGYVVIGRSYEESEADEEYTFGKGMLEDELWNRIRINPDKLPKGQIQLVPGTTAARLRHKHLAPLTANVKVANYEGVLYPGKFLNSYTIEYPTDHRTLVIIFESRFPHKIVGWEETYKSKDNLLTSRAVLKKTILTDYWHHNAPADSTLREAFVSSR